MKVVEGIINLSTFYPDSIVLALGNFDGVHLGHQKVIKTAVDQARHSGHASAALIFTPHPLKVLTNDNNLGTLTNLDIKAELLAKLGLDYMIVEPFTTELAEIRPEEFLNNYLKKNIKLEGIVAGYDYTFGYRARGNVDFLINWGSKEKVNITICDPVKIGDEPVSSSSIRKKILAGRVDEAASFLNYYFFRRGRVITGRGKGKKLGYPTANLEIDPELLLPQEGVYFTLVKHNNAILPGATNVGRCPTFALEHLTIEVNIIDFDENIYDKCLTIYFVQKIREEKNFSCTEDLKNQLRIDVENVKYLANSKQNDFYVLQR